MSEMSNMSYDIMPFEVTLKTRQPNSSIVDFLHIRNDKGNYDSVSTVESESGHIEHRYTGSRYNGKRHGPGTLITISGYKYEGEFDNDEPYGFGTLTTPDGSVIKGYWIKGRLEGFGSEKWTDGSSYEGEYKNGLKDGKGTYKWSNNFYYKGDWLEDQLNGMVN